MIHTNIIKSNLPILLTGEPGVGKSHYASQLNSIRNNCFNNFQTFHVGTVDESLFSSELFGHKKGSFTGAISDKTGFCGLVNKGILFIDEVSELSISNQMKLLELLEERRYRKIGSTNYIQFLGKVVLASNKDLFDLVQKQKFRKDLYDRISFFEVKIKPLRDNIELLKELYDMYYIGFDVDPCLKSFILNYHWPANVREFVFLNQYFKLVKENGNIGLKDLPLKYKEIDKINLKLTSYKKEVIRHDDYLIRLYLNQGRGRINHTCKLMGVAKNTLLSKIKKYNIDTYEFQS